MANDRPVSYIRELFRTALERFRKHPALAGIVAREMARNYALVPWLTDGVLDALDASGLGEHERIVALDLVFGVLAGLLLIETGTAQTEKARAEALREEASALSAAVFPQLTTSAKALVNRIVKRPGQDAASADRYADLVILSLKLGSTQKISKPRKKGS
jgi:hypothetical protein